MIDHSLFFRVDDSHFGEPVERLALGATCDVLRACGITTLGELFRRIEVEPQGLRGIKGLDRDALTLVAHRLTALSNSLDDGGRLEWSKFESCCPSPGDKGHAKTPAGPSQSGDKAAAAASRRPITLVPSRELRTGIEFMASFPEAIEAVIQSREAEVDRLILTERLSRDPHQRRTLEGVAAKAGGRLSRERIRQREQKLIDLLAAAMINGRGKRLGVQFHPSFRAFWERAAERFGQREQVGFWEFIKGLAKEWEVPADQLVAHLPLILAVLTRKATLPAAIREQMKLAPRVLTALDDADRKAPLGMLMLGSTGARLTDQGLETVGDLLDAIEHGSVALNKSVAGQRVQLSLGALDKALSDAGRIDWIRYGAAMGLPHLPSALPSSPFSFLTNLRTNIEEILTLNKITLRASDIFRRRIAVPRAARPTLAQVAEELRTHGPSIKREETVLLQILNDLLVERDLTHSKSTLSHAFLTYWDEAADVFSHTERDFPRFCRALTERWNIPISGLTEAEEILWAVLNEYPGGRARKKKSRDTASVIQRGTVIAGGVIVLRGFRRLH